MTDPSLKIVPLGFQQIAATAAVMSLTVPEGARMARITVAGNAVRYRDDGTDPTAAIGVALPVTTAGLPFDYNGNLAAIRLIAQTGTASLDVLYYR